MCVPDDVLCYQETDLMLGILIRIKCGKTLGKPLVICIAISSAMTGHEAAGATSSYINNLGQMAQVNIYLLPREMKGTTAGIIMAM